jgi:hypothetical protein
MNIENPELDESRELILFVAPMKAGIHQIITRTDMM